MAYGTTNAQKKQSASALTFSQLVNITSVESGVEQINSATFKNNTYTSGNFPANITTISFVANHKYYLKGSADYRLYLDGGTTQAFGTIFAPTENKNATKIYTNTYPLGVFSFVVIDLTATFGSGLEPSLSECEAIFNQDYYAYGSNTIDVLVDGASVYASYQKPLAEFLKNKGEVEFNQISNNINVNQDFASGGVSEGSQYYVNINLVENPTIVSGHKYYAFGKINSATNVSSIRVYYNSNANVFSLTTTAHAEVITIYNVSLYRVYKATSSTASANYTLNLIDLTTMFGSGAEPDLATCQAIFSADYYAYESGKTCMLVADNNNNACFIPKGQVVIKNDLLDMVYPIGAIYMSVNSTSPATLFGGTWEQLKDRFLLGAGDTYTNGSTGGEATHTLTVNEMPSHDHPITCTYQTTGSPSASSTSIQGTNNYLASYSKTDARGGGQAHNNMPPYLVVYMWQRTA